MHLREGVPPLFLMKAKARARLEHGMGARGWGKGQMGVGYCDLLCLLHRSFIFWKCVSATLRGYSKSRGVLAVSCVTYYPRGNTFVAASIHLCDGDGGWQARREKVTTVFILGVCI